MSFRRVSMSGRQSKWERDKTPCNLVIQRRDEDIICALYDYRYLSREQIQKLFQFTCTSKANIRLRRLYDHAYLSRSFLPTSRGSSKAIYFIGTKGIQIISERLGIDPMEVKRDMKTFSRVKDLFLDHQLALNEVRISFVQAISSDPYMRLDRWISDHDCAQKYYNSNPGGEAKNVIRPDSYFRFWNKNRLFSYFVELDRATMSHKRFRAKVKAYLEFAQSGSYQKIFGVKYFRVLVIAPSEQRMSNLIKTVEEVTDKIFWFTSVDSVIKDGGFGPIWYRAGHDGLHPLIGIEL
jgi:hypothetical protein